MKIHKTKNNFEVDLQKGLSYEGLIHRVHPNLERYNGREFDFTLNGRNVELKVETYWDSPYFFFEKYSDLKKKTLGGPFRALGDDPDSLYFDYLIKPTSVGPELVCGYQFETKSLVEKLEELERGNNVIVRDIENIHNGSEYTTRGYLIPKLLVIDLAIGVTDFSVALKAPENLPNSLLNMSEAADFLKIKKATLYGWVKEKRVPFRRHGKKILFIQTELEAWSNQQSDI